MTDMTNRMKILHHLLFAEEGDARDEKGDHIAHRVKGKWHIAFGHLLDDEQTDEELKIMGLEDELDDWEGFTVNEEQAHALFEMDVREAIRASSLSFSEVELRELNDTRWAIIISMCYQMGSVVKFTHFIEAVKKKHWARAADEMLWSNGLKKQKRSAWYIETPKRCQRAADAMLAGSFFEQQTKTPPTKIRVELPKGLSPRETVDMLQLICDELRTYITTQ